MQSGSPGRTVDGTVRVGFAVLTCDDAQQALDRAGRDCSSEDKHHEAVTAAVSTALPAGVLLGQHD